eukprot:TRINITY_DN3020_c0_g1_i2.p1 TRINITY_DN3020_c0_g1~~TRINITY_DN3020_c0_g1_i2.p1  ORF type:complete len:135 (-),score=1.09 TRINITY_DN3020_c0_g1_i2:75-479(-)
MPSLVTTVTCHLKVWFLGISFILSFGALFSRSYRLYALTKIDEKISFSSDRPIRLMILCLLAIELVLLAVFTGVSRIEAVLEKYDKFRRSTWKYTCVVSLQYWVVLGILIGLNVNFLYSFYHFFIKRLVLVVLT